MGRICGSVRTSAGAWKAGRRAENMGDVGCDWTLCCALGAGEAKAGVVDNWLAGWIVRRTTWLAADGWLGRHACVYVCERFCVWKVWWQDDWKGWWLSRSPRGHADWRVCGDGDDGGVGGWVVWGEGGWGRVMRMMLAWPSGRIGAQL